MAGPDAGEAIHVLVRVRPLSAREVSQEGGTPALAVEGRTRVLAKGEAFGFDAALGEDSTNEDVYRTRTEDIVRCVVDGFNGTVFAYGQTSSGKTHTMKGQTTDDMGIIPRAVNDAFKRLRSDTSREFLVRVSYVELYNEDIMDLLDEPPAPTMDMKPPQPRKLQIHESAERGVYVAGLREVLVTKPEQVLALMEQGEARRHVGETNMNARSSRSHTLFRMVVESRVKADTPVTDAVKVSVLTLVDLAGSERASKTGAEGNRLKEGAHINKSLLTLGTVINKLSEGRQGDAHIPYRDSKLTRILQPSLGGNAKTAIICNVTPSPLHMEETLSTLRFASRAKQVTNNAVVNEVLSDQALLRRQAEEINTLKRRLARAASGGELDVNAEERGELEAMIDQLEAARGTSADSDSARAALEAERDELAAQLEAARGTSTDSDSARAALEAERDELAAQLEAARDELAAQLEAARGTSADSDSARAALEAERDALAAQLEAARGTSADSDSARAALEAERDALAAQLEAARGTSADSDSARAALEAERDELAAQLSEMRKRADMDETERTRLALQVRDLQNAPPKADEGLQDALEAARAEAARLSTALASAEERASSATEAAAKRESQLRRMHVAYASLKEKVRAAPLSAVENVP